MSVWRWLVTTTLMVGLGMSVAPEGNADPAADSPPNPYPDDRLIVRSYELRPADQFFNASAGGVWFTTPLGLTCGIWDREALAARVTFVVRHREPAVSVGSTGTS